MARHRCGTRGGSHAQARPRASGKLEDSGPGTASDLRATPWNLARGAQFVYSSVDRVRVRSCVGGPQQAHTSPYLSQGCDQVAAGLSASARSPRECITMTVVCSCSCRAGVGRTGEWKRGRDQRGVGGRATVAAWVRSNAAPREGGRPPHRAGPGRRWETCSGARWRLLALEGGQRAGRGRPSPGLERSARGS